METDIENQINILSIELQNEINGTVNHAYIMGKIEAYSV